MKIDNDFIMTLESLSDISDRNLQNWEGQRPINEDRVNELESYFEKDLNKYGKIQIRTPIYIAKYKHNHYIIDGQHRFNALASLINKGIIEDMKILVGTIDCRNKTQVQKEFNNINNVTPMPSCYVNPNELVDKVLSLLTDKYLNFVKPDKRIYRPNINIDSFKSELINSKIINKFTHPEALLDLFDQLQQKYKNLTDKELCLKLSCKLEEPMNNILKKIKANDNYHYIGIFLSKMYWIWVSDIEQIFESSLKK